MRVRWWHPPQSLEQIRRESSGDARELASENVKKYARAYAKTFEKKRARLDGKAHAAATQEARTVACIRIVFYKFEHDVRWRVDAEYSPWHSPGGLRFRWLSAFAVTGPHANSSQHPQELQKKEQSRRAAACRPTCGARRRTEKETADHGLEGFWC